MGWALTWLTVAGSRGSRTCGRTCGDFLQHWTGQSPLDIPRRSRRRHRVGSLASFGAAAAQARCSHCPARPIARGGPAPCASRDLDAAGLCSPVLSSPVLRRDCSREMSFLSRQQPPPTRRVAAACSLRQKLIFSPGSDCEEEEEEEEEGSGHSTGEDSAFQEPDSPLPSARSPAEAEAERRRRSPGTEPSSPGELEDDLLLRGGGGGAQAAGGGAEGDSWEEEGFGSSSPVKSPTTAYFLGSSFSPVRCGDPGDASPQGCGAPRAMEDPCSPQPDYPSTPPHKTFRKLRLFDTPHTPKVIEGAEEPAPVPLKKKAAAPQPCAPLPGFGYITAPPHPARCPAPPLKKKKKLAAPFLALPRSCRLRLCN